MTSVTATTAQGALPARPGRRRFSWTWLGLVPFFAFAGLFLLIPTFYLVVGSFQDKAGQLTLQNYVDLGSPQISNAFLLEPRDQHRDRGPRRALRLPARVRHHRGGLPGPLRAGVLTFSGVASNFAGVPLAIAVRLHARADRPRDDLLKNVFGIDIYDNGFTLYSKIGLEIVYFYFQFPLMVLIMAPAIDGLKREWREAAENMGGSSAQYWRYVALPILTPTILGTMILLFGNAFGAQATAYQLTGGTLPIVTCC
jgi:putative spermidine/putrescine transport system permease protein